jgi:hypothetical protein
MAFLALLLPRAAAALALVLTPNSSLSFGQIIATGSPGIVTVTPEGMRSASDGAALASSLGVAAASFTVTGDPDASYGITLPPSATLSGRSSSMTIDHFSISSGAGNLGAGMQVFSVGAELHVGASQLSAAYSGTYEISVAYN